MKLAHSLPIFFLLGIAGCSNPDMKDLSGFIEEVKQRPPARIEPLPEIPEIQTYTYSSQDLRNPFAPAACLLIEAPVRLSGFIDKSESEQGAGSINRRGA